MSWYRGYLAYRTAQNTGRTAVATEATFTEQQRDRLERAGVVGFNAPDNVVRAAQRQLAIERGEQVRTVRTPAALARLAWWSVAIGLAAFVGGLLTGGAVATVAYLVVIGAALALWFALAEWQTSRRVEADAEALAAYEAQRGASA